VRKNTLIIAEEIPRDQDGVSQSQWRLLLDVADI